MDHPLLAVLVGFVGTMLGVIAHSLYRKHQKRNQIDIIIESRSQQPDGTPVYNFACTLCGKRFWAGVRHLTTYDDKVKCLVCGAQDSLASIQEKMRRRMRTVSEEKRVTTCIHCFRGPEDHANDKCLFGPSTYKARGEL